jgi:hypothetical protein
MGDRGPLSWLPRIELVAVTPRLLAAGHWRRGKIGGSHLEQAAERLTVKTVVLDAHVNRFSTPCRALPKQVAPGKKVLSHAL